jgi:hypothetical protein
VILDRQFNVVRTFINGEPVFARDVSAAEQ